MNEETPKHRLQPRQRAEHEETMQSESKEIAFDSVEALLRHDLEHTPPPEAIRSKLQESLATDPPRISWWKKWLG